ncbi:hypothetical protein ACXXDK_01390 [Deinococcus sp. PESE-38]
MPEERPFLALSEPNPAGEDAAGAVPDALFDLAVNRAAAAVRGVSLSSRAGDDALAAWHVRTRFARRVALADIRAALDLRPAGGQWHWAGGRRAAGSRGKPRFPDYGG